MEIPGLPKAFLNWVMLDERFEFVQGGADYMGGDGELKELVTSDLPVSRNGYLYVYVSNETPNIDVFFDNLQVTHVRGALLEETHYYPFGLTQKGISSKALSFGGPVNKEKTFQGQRFDDDLGVNWIQFNWRTHDPLIGRFLQVDPLSEEYEYNSTYAFSENKVTTHVELEGLEAERFDRQVERDLRDINSKKITREQLEARVNARNNAGAVAYAIVSLFTPGPDEVIVMGLLGKAVSVGTKADKINDARKILDKTNDAEKTVEKSAELKKAEERAAKLSEKQRPGEDFTKAGKDATKDVNKAKNNGQLQCEGCGQNVQNASKHKKGQTPPSNEAHVDHKVPKSKGGSGTPDNGQVLCRGCNLEKGAN